MIVKSLKMESQRSEKKLHLRYVCSNKYGKNILF